MAILKFVGRVNGYNDNKKGGVNLSVEELAPSNLALAHVDNLRSVFNPKDVSRYGYACKNLDCDMTPDFASYRFTASSDQIKNISYGSTVEVEFDVYNVLTPYLANTSGNGKRWSSMTNIRYELISIKAVSDAFSSPVQKEKVGK